MIPVTFNAVTAYLLDDAPNWASSVQVEATLPANTERGLSGRETRRATAATLRLACRYTALIKTLTAVNSLRNSLQALSTENVLCPFWPGRFEAGATPPVTAAFYALFNDDKSFASIQASAALPFALTAYPLMVGILADNPEPTLLARGRVSVEFHFTENGNYPLTPAAFTAPDGLDTAGGVRPLFPFTPNWSTLPVSGAAEQDLTRRQIGELRTLATAYFAQRSRRKVKQYFTLADNDGFNLLRFFLDMGGEVNNFWLGAAISEAELTANVGAASTSLTVDNGAALGTNAFVLLGDRNQRVPLVVSSVAGNTWNLADAPGTDFSAADARIESLVLARFDLLKLSLSFAAPQFARAEISFKELPWETNAVAGETYGTTMGALPVTAILFTFSQTTPSGTTYWRCTNFERDLTNGGHTWSSAPLEFDTITDTADLKRNVTTITSRNFAGNPLALLFPLALEWPLMVEISEVDVDLATDAASNLRAYFYGEVGTADLEPPFITARCQTLSHIFDQQIPRRQYQRRDNWPLFSAANGLLPGDWQWNAVVVSYDPASTTLVVDTITSTNPATLAAHWFAAGYLIITAAAGGAQQVRLISDNAAPSAGSLTLQLSQALLTAPTAGDVVNMFPGYDGQSKTTVAKFDNYARFGGFPFMPVGNPSVMRISQPTGGGKK